MTPTPRGIRFLATSDHDSGSSRDACAPIDAAPSDREAIRRFREPPAAGAFTLVEMLAVLGIIAVLLGLVIPVMNSLRGSGDFNLAVGGITGIFEQARAYAVANNTYVYVGIGEFDVTQSTGATGQTAGIGRVVLCVASTRDGTRGYDINNPSNWTANYTTSIVANLSAIDKLRFFDNVHLADFSTLTAPPAGSKMDRPPVQATAYMPAAAYFLGNTNASYNVATPLAWPLGSTLTAGYQYLFNKVVQFDPQGVARLQFSTGGDSIAPTLEADLQPTHGNAAPALPADQNTGNQAAIQINCTTGAVRFYRP